MGIASIVLGVLSLLFTVAGFFVSWIPVVGSYVGALLSFGAPVLALIGVILGGVSLSRAKADNLETGVPTAGLIVSGISFFPALLVALTCGICDVLCAGAHISAPPPGSRPTPSYFQDGGAGPSPGLGVGTGPIPAAPAGPAPAPVAPAAPTPAAPTPAPAAPPADPSADPTQGIERVPAGDLPGNPAAEGAGQGVPPPPAFDDP